jgi:two-component system response regulator MtrA
MPSRLLLIEDDPQIQELAAIVLMESGFDVEVSPDAPDPATVPWERFELVVLDVGLPTGDGFDLCREIRARSAVPIVMLTARDATADVVRGLDAGADDYLTKPFEPEELAARARAAARRHVPGSGSRLAERDLVIDERAFLARRGDEELDLTATELRLLIALASRAGEVLTRHELLAAVWGYDYLGDSRLVDMAVLRLRRKLDDGRPGSAPYVTTVRSEGYRLDP